MILAFYCLLNNYAQLYYAIHFNFIFPFRPVLIAAYNGSWSVLEVLLKHRAIAVDGVPTVHLDLQVMLKQRALAMDWVTTIYLGLQVLPKQRALAVDWVPTFLCTGGRHYALYRFLSISNKFCFQVYCTAFSYCTSAVRFYYCTSSGLGTLWVPGFEPGC